MVVSFHSTGQHNPAGGLSRNVTDDCGTTGVTRRAADNLALSLLRSTCSPLCERVRERPPTRLPQRGLGGGKPPSLLVFPLQRWPQDEQLQAPL